MQFKLSMRSLFHVVFPVFIVGSCEGVESVVARPILLDIILVGLVTTPAPSFDFFQIYCQ